VGSGASWLGAALLAPFVVLVAIAAVRLPFGGLAAARTAFAETPPTAGSSAFLGGVLLCMWNYMGFDNASTIVTEVSEPQRVYPRAMLGTLALIAGCYLSSVAAASVAGVPLASWTTGAWTTVAERLGGPVLGPVLALAIVLGGAISAFGMFNALLLSASRLPVALAHDGFLPRFVGYASPRTGAPVVAILLSALAYASCLTLGLKRLVQIDVALYGVALLLEFVALVALRLREPELVRPFRVPGGTVAAALLGVPPMALLGTALWMTSRADRGEIAAFGLTSFQLAAVVALGGPLLYFVGALRSRSARSRSASGV
jgi:amino acid transporter